MILQIAGSLEQQSEHPLAKAIVAKAQELGLELEKPLDFTALPGKGIKANFGEQRVAGVPTPLAPSTWRNPKTLRVR
ncbi:hypothetical protein BCD64_00610 [Nostoc sp. MBR 210]|nr:hypothetical protein BCD64_00610 [Nostoc sp. MBR 210]